jgi:hypothetical protein
MTIGNYYLAARFPRREEMAGIAEMINANDPLAKCCARWVFGGEDGLTRSQIASLDLADVAEAETVILFTHEHGTPQPGGGRFVEFGYALALNKRCIVIGDYENVFISTPGVLVYPDLKTFIRNELPVERPEAKTQLSLLDDLKVTFVKDNGYLI